MRGADIIGEANHASEEDRDNEGDDQQGNDQEEHGEEVNSTQNDVDGFESEVHGYGLGASAAR